MGYFINNGKISSIHGRSFWSGGRLVVPMYHPAAALHQPSLRDVVKEDFSKLPTYLQKAMETRKNNPELAELNQMEMDDDSQDEGKAEQLSLF